MIETGRWVRRTRRLGIGALLAVIVVLGTPFWAYTQVLGSGPLNPHWQDGTWTSTGLPVEHRGAVFTFTQVTLDNRGDRPATIDRVVLIPPPHGMHVRLVRAFIVRQPRGPSGVAAGVVGPPTTWYQHLHAAKGAEIVPHDPHLISLGLEVTTPPGFRNALRLEFAIAEGIRVYYHVGPNHYVDSWYTQIVLCHGSCNSYSQREWPPPPVTS